jgi:hypothetical protein
VVGLDDTIHRPRPVLPEKGPDMSRAAEPLDTRRATIDQIFKPRLPLVQDPLGIREEPPSATSIPRSGPSFAEEVPAMESMASESGMKSGSALPGALARPQPATPLTTEVVDDPNQVEFRTEGAKESAGRTVFEPQATKSNSEGNEIPFQHDIPCASNVTEREPEQAVRLSRVLKPILFLAGILLGSLLSVRYPSHEASVPCSQRSFP